MVNVRRCIIYTIHESLDCSSSIFFLVTGTLLFLRSSSEDGLLPFIVASCRCWYTKRSNQLTTTVGCVDRENTPQNTRTNPTAMSTSKTESLMLLMFNTVFVHHFCWSGGTSSNSCQCPRPHLPCRVLPLPPPPRRKMTMEPRRNMTMEMNNDLAINFF